MARFTVEKKELQSEKGTEKRTKVNENVEKQEKGCFDTSWQVNHFRIGRARVCVTMQTSSLLLLLSSIFPFSGCCVAAIDGRLSDT